jgi:hypothetical protein
LNTMCRYRQDHSILKYPKALKLSTNNRSVAIAVGMYWTIPSSPSPNPHIRPGLEATSEVFLQPVCGKLLSRLDAEAKQKS